VLFDDGDSEKACYRRKLRCAGEKQSRLCLVGDEVDAKCSALEDQIVPGVVVSAKGADTYDVKFKLSHIRNSCSKLRNLEPECKLDGDSFTETMARNFMFARYQIPPSAAK
jgi:hypothetical protein